MTEPRKFLRIERFMHEGRHSLRVDQVEATRTPAAFYGPEEVQELCAELRRLFPEYVQAQPPGNDALEQLRCAQINFGNFADVLPPMIRSHPFFLIAEQQLQDGIEALEGRPAP